mgnify:CR=1 FL=1
MNNKIDPNLIEMRDLSEQDIPLILNYWYHSPQGFFESMGVDLTKMLTESEMEKKLREKLSENKTLQGSKLNVVIILYNKEAIGNHTINPLVEGDHGIFHAHIWKMGMRGKGLGVYTYPKACKIFMQRFNLKKILFKTPIQNISAIRVKEKLGIRFVGEEIIDFGIVRAGTRAKVFELTKEEVDKKWEQKTLNTTPLQKPN